jgi:hypothetical protein
LGLRFCVVITGGMMVSSLGLRALRLSVASIFQENWRYFCFALASGSSQVNVSIWDTGERFALPFRLHSVSLRACSSGCRFGKTRSDLENPMVFHVECTQLGDEVV